MSRIVDGSIETHEIHPPRGRWSRARSGWPAWELALVGVVAAIVAIGLGVLASVSADQRAARLGDAMATEQRLAVNGVDDNLTSDLILLQQHEVAVFQGNVDSSAQQPQPQGIGDPGEDLHRVEADLAALADQLSGSPQVLKDVSLIRQELTVYTALEATALADNQQGLPVGTAYLREASGYLRDAILPTADGPSADDLSAMDRARLVDDDRAAAGSPALLITAAAVSVAYLAIAQILLARRTHRVINPGLFAASLLVVGLAGWSLTATLLSRHEVVTRAAPHARSAVDLADVQGAATRVGLDDQLTQADHGEDCTGLTSPASGNRLTVFTYTSTCTYEQEALDFLKASDPVGVLGRDLATTARDTPDATVRGLLDALRGTAAAWMIDEKGLPTLQNLAQYPAGLTSPFPRYSNQYLANVLPTYTDPAAARQVGQAVADDYATFHQVAAVATGREWADFAARAHTAARDLDGLVVGAVVLGALAAAAAGAGVGRTVREYWSIGGND